VEVHKISQPYLSIMLISADLRRVPDELKHLAYITKNIRLVLSSSALYTEQLSTVVTCVTCFHDIFSRNQAMEEHAILTCFMVSVSLSSESECIVFIQITTSTPTLFLIILGSQTHSTLQLLQPNSLT
jgi:hypothetical protein